MQSNSIEIQKKFKKFNEFGQQNLQTKTFPATGYCHQQITIKDAEDASEILFGIKQKSPRVEGQVVIAGWDKWDQRGGGYSADETAVGIGAVEAPARPFPAGRVSIFPRFIIALVSFRHPTISCVQIGATLPTACGVDTGVIQAGCWTEHSADRQIRGC